MEKNRINFAKYSIFLYAETLWTCISDLLSDDLEELTNIKAHGLSKAELTVVLFELFDSQMLVAKSRKRGLFTPSLIEVEQALHEQKDCMDISVNTFYGITTGSAELFRELKNLYSVI